MTRTVPLSAETRVVCNILLENISHSKRRVGEEVAKKEPGSFPLQSSCFAFSYVFRSLQRQRSGSFWDTGTLPRGTLVTRTN